MRRIAGALLLAALTSPVCAGDKMSMTYGVGNLTCDTLNRAAKAEVSSEVTPWVSGYITAAGGILIVLAKEKLAHTDVASLEKWVMDYCRDHPQDKINTAAEFLMESLIKKARASEVKQ